MQYKKKKRKKCSYTVPVVVLENTFVTNHNFKLKVLSSWSRFLINSNSHFVGVSRLKVDLLKNKQIILIALISMVNGLFVMIYNNYWYNWIRY